MKEATATDKCPFHGPQTLEERIRQYSIYQPWLQDDPIPVFDEMREHAPIVRSEEFGGYWILTRYEDVEWAARNPEIFSNAQVGIPHREIFPAKQIPVQLDGDEHRKWRQALSDLFNPGVVNQITPQLRQATIDTIEPLVEKGRCDFIEDVAVKLPAEAFLINFGIGRGICSRCRTTRTGCGARRCPRPATTRTSARRTSRCGSSSPTRSTGAAPRAPRAASTCSAGC